MQKFNGSLVRQFPSLVTGNAAAGVSVTVLTGASGSNLATLFSGNGTGSLPNPLTTDSAGYYGFYAADGVYRLRYSMAGIPDQLIQLVDVDAIRNDFDAIEASNAAFLIQQQTNYDNFVLSQGWDQVGTFAAGFTFTSPNQVGQDTDGNWWRWNGVFPKVVTAGTLPSSDANYKLVGDGVLRSDLAAPDSDVLVGGVEAGVLAEKSQVIQLPLGSNNVAYGEGAMAVTDGVLPVGSDNVAVGKGALQNNTEGYRSVVVGYQAAFLNQGTLVYGNSLVAVGYRALYNNEEGKDNTAVGYLSQFFTKGGSGNSSLGYRALYSTTGVTDGPPAWASINGSFNTSMGYESMLETTLGNSNSAYGWRSLFLNTTGNRNTALGQEAMRNSLTASNNTAVGYSAMRNGEAATNCSALGYESMIDNTANNNSAFGYRAMFKNTSAVNNSAFGTEALRDNLTGTNNAAFGYRALMLSLGADNSAFGASALRDNVAGTNSAFGRDALLLNTTGLGNTSIGYQALDANTTANFSTAVGRGALGAANGNNNTAIGYLAGDDITTATGCTALGVNALDGNTIFSNCTGVGQGALVTNNNQVQLGNSATTTYAFGAVQDRSDERDKLDIKALTDAHIAFFMDVEWRQYRMDYRESYREIADDGEVILHDKDGSRAGKRYHVGAVAQQVEAAMKKHNVDFAGLQHHAVNGGDDIYSIGYQEFIGIQGEIIQRQQKRLDSIEARLQAAGL